MGAVVGQADLGEVQAQAVTCDSAGDCTRHVGACGVGGAVVDLGERAPNRGSRAQNSGCDGGHGVRQGGRREAVVRGDAGGLCRVDAQGATASRCNSGGQGYMRVVVGQGDARGVQAQGVPRHSAGDRTGHCGAGRSGGAIVGLGEGATDAGCAGQCFRRDGRRSAGDGRRREAVVRNQTVGRGRPDPECAAPTGDHRSSAHHVSVVVGQCDARCVQVQRVTGDAAADRAGDCRAGGCGGAVIGLGERASDAGRGGQRLGCDDRGSVGDRGRGETVVRRHTVGGGRTDGECAGARGNHGICGGHMGGVIGQ